MGNCACTEETSCGNSPATARSHACSAHEITLHPYLKNHANYLQEADWHGFYEQGPGALLGKGSYGEVFRAFRKGTNGKKTSVAVKTMNFTDMARKDGEDIIAEALHQECDLLLKAKHPSIIKLYDVFYCKVANHLEFAMAMELVPSKPLFDWWKEHRVPNLGDLSIIYRDILRGLEYLVNAHPDYPVTHRDLKHENVLVLDNWDGADSVAKLIDFGFAKSGYESAITTNLGTNHYKAPEVQHKALREHRDDGYGQEGKCDVWSIGVMLYEMVAGKRPFGKHGGYKVLWQEEQATWDNPGHKPVKELLQNMLVPHERERWTAQECLSHSEFLNGDQQKHAIDQHAFANFKKTNLKSMHATGLVGLAYVIMHNTGMKSAQ
eukprot:SAG31_NODE_408_length_16015_cov_77.203569_10_plen_379_part_00